MASSSGLGSGLAKFLTFLVVIIGLIASVIQIVEYVNKLNGRIVYNPMELAMMHHLPIKTIGQQFIDNPNKRAIINIQYTCQASTLIRQAQMWQVFF